MNFLDIHNSFDEARFVIIPAKIGGTSVGQKGAQNAPEHIIRASWQIEDWDTELRFDFTRSKLHTMPPITSLEELYEVSLRVIERRKTPIIIGGEHTLTHVVIKALKEKHKSVSAVFFDAHADMFDEFEGNKVSHACALFLSLPFLKDFISIGIRNIAVKELKMIKELKLEDRFVFFEDLVYIDEHDGGTKIRVNLVEEKLKDLSGDSIYISFDFDFLDPSCIPSLSTPEPPGLSFVQAFFILRKVIQHFRDRIKGVDFVEFCPQDLFASDVSAAKVISKVIAYLSFWSDGSGVTN